MVSSKEDFNTDRILFFFSSVHGDCYFKRYDKAFFYSEEEEYPERDGNGNFPSSCGVLWRYFG